MNILVEFTVPGLTEMRDKLIKSVEERFAQELGDVYADDFDPTNWAPSKPHLMATILDPRFKDRPFTNLPDLRQMAIDKVG